MQAYKYLRQIVDTWCTKKDPAILYGDAKKVLTYSEFAQRILNEENNIRKTEIHSELFITDHEPDTLIRLFACVLAGCDIVLVDESTPDESLYALAKSARCDSVYSSDSDLMDELTEFRMSGSGSCDTAGPEPSHTVPPADIYPSESPHSVDSAVRESSTEGRLIFFTSGTTGNSRAVVLTTRSLLASCYSGQSMLPCGPGDIILSLLPLSHVFGFVCTMLWGLTYGAAIALGRGTGSVLSDCRFFEPTILPVVPSLIKMLFVRQCLGQNLKAALIGAAPLDYDTVTALQNEGIKVYLGYGLTETSSGIAITQKQDDPYALYPCPGAMIRIENDNEISVVTPCMMDGYLDLSAVPLIEDEKSAFSDIPKKHPAMTDAHGDPKKKTASALGRPIIPVSEGRFYTGDLGCLDENGALRLIGRKKDMLVLDDGNKIFCPEYEKELSDLLGISDLTVILKKNRPVLVIGDPADTLSESTEHLIDSFNEEKIRSLQIGSIIYYGRPLPKTATGKIKRWEIEKTVCFEFE